MFRCPLAAFASTFALLAICACSPQGDEARLDRIEKRLDALEKHATPVSAPAGGAVKPTASGPAAPEAKPDPSSYSPGAIAIVHAAPTDTRQLAEAPADSVGGFVYTGGPLALHDLSSRGVRYSGLAGVELQGWLRVATAGRTQIAADVRGSFSGAIFGPTCVLQVWLEDRQIGLAQERLALTPQDRSDTSLVVGAELQPGVYKLRLWTACHPPSGPKNARVTIDLLTKAPGELNLRGFTGEDLLHAPPK